MLAIERQIVDFQVILSDRQRDAISELGGTAAFEEGLSLLWENFPLFRVENVGVGERRVSRSFRLSDRGWELAEKLQARVEQTFGLPPRTTNRSVVARQAIDLLIHRHRLVGFYKPDGWESRPLTLIQGGENPVILRDDLAVVITARFPLNLWRQIQGVVSTDRSQSLNLSNFLREAIDGIVWESLPNYEPPILVRDRRVVGLTQPISLAPYQRQLEILEEVKTLLEIKTASSAISTVLNQALQQGTVPWIWEVIQPRVVSPQAQNLYELACREGVNGAAAQWGGKPEKLLSLLIAEGYLEPRPGAKA